MYGRICQQYRIFRQDKVLHNKIKSDPQDRMGEDIRARLAEEEEGADAYGSWLDRWSHSAVLCL